MEDTRQMFYRFSVKSDSDIARYVETGYPIVCDYHLREIPDNSCLVSKHYVKEAECDVCNALEK